MNADKSVFVSIRFPSFLIVNRLQAVTPCILRYMLIFSSVPCFSILSRIIPLQLLSVLCSVTVTFTLKNFVIFKRFSDCDFLFVSTKNVPFFNCFTFFGVPIMDYICVSIINVDKDVIGFSSLLEIAKNFSKFSFALNVNVVSCVSSSKESNARNRFREAMVINVLFDSCAPHPPWSPTRGRLTEMDLLFLTSRLHCYYTRCQDQSLQLGIMFI